jgi:hypothetical protein
VRALVRLVDERERERENVSIRATFSKITKGFGRGCVWEEGLGRWVGEYICTYKLHIGFI